MDWNCSPDFCHGEDLFLPPSRKRKFYKICTKWTEYIKPIRSNFWLFVCLTSSCLCGFHCSTWLLFNSAHFCKAVITECDGSLRKNKKEETLLHINSASCSHGNPELLGCLKSSVQVFPQDDPAAQSFLMFLPGCCPGYRRLPGPEGPGRPLADGAPQQPAALPRDPGASC